MNYKLDADQARTADQRGGAINETGKYVGAFTRAEEVTANSGTQGIDFTFKSKDGRSCRFAIYTEKSDGAQIKIGRAYVMAMMACLRLREIAVAPARVRKWDMDANAEVEVMAPCFADLMNKPIGVLLEAEEYEKRNGDIGKRMVLAGVFQAETELTAGEILDRKTTPIQLGKMVETLRDRPLRKGIAHHAGSAPAKSPTGFDDMDDDIPF